MGRKAKNGRGKESNGSPKKKRSQGRPNPGKKRAFLAAFSVCGNVRLSCEIAQCSMTQVYERLKPESPRFDPDFVEKFEAAKEESIQRLEQEMRRRAEEGTRRFKFTKNGDLICIPDPSGKTQKVKRWVKEGKKTVEREFVVPVMVPYVEHEYSDTLAIFLAKSLRPEIYRENYTVNGRMDGVHLHLQGGQMPTTNQLINETLEYIKELQRQTNGKVIESNGYTNGSERG